MEGRSVQIAANHAEGERGHVCVAVALPVGLAVRDHVHRHVVGLMVLLEVDRRRPPVLQLGKDRLPLFALIKCPGVAGLQVLGEEGLRVEVAITAVAVLDRGSMACGSHDLFAPARHKPLEVAHVHVVLLVEEDDAFQLVEASGVRMIRRLPSTTP